MTPIINLRSRMKIKDIIARMVIYLTVLVLCFACMIGSICLISVLMKFALKGSWQFALTLLIGICMLVPLAKGLNSYEDKRQNHKKGE